MTCDLCATHSLVCNSNCHHCNIRDAARGTQKDRMAVKKFLVGIGWEPKAVDAEMLRIREIDGRG